MCSRVFVLTIWLNTATDVIEVGKVYSDDITLTEILHISTASFMKSVIDDLDTGLIIKCNENQWQKNQENELLRPITKDMPPSLILNGTTVEKVTSFKLLTWCSRIQ